MKRLHYAVFTQSGNGHVYPVLPLCAELARRGHRVTYATSDYYAPIISACGVEPVVFKSSPISDDLKRDLEIGLPLSIDDPRYAKMLKSWRSYSFEETRSLLYQVSEFYNRNVPDVVLYDRFHIPGRIVAKWFGIPLVQFSAHFAYYKGFAIRRNGIYENPNSLVEHSKELDEFLAQFGIMTKSAYWHTEALNLHFIPRDFQHGDGWFDERFCFTGCLLNRPFVPTWENRSNGRPIILISGLSFLCETKINYGEYFRTFIEALADLPCHCILSVGEEALLSEPPTNFELNRRASHLEILPYASLAICHGGMTTLLESIYTGVPVLMIPQTEDCDENAYRVEELGLGIRLPNESVSADILREAVISMLADKALHNRVENMKQVFRRSGGALLAADRVERLSVGSSNGGLDTSVASWRIL
jgi:MGT family glycosyltransferase